ncbi:MAG: beta-galactosidase, partial [Sedimentisphaerales bacterium]|nr:beta-galactosidase [Sedimentisphaerales bacterium]
MKNTSIKIMAIFVVVGTIILAAVGPQARAETITVRPVEINNMLHNPDVGWCLYIFGWDSVEDSTVNLTGDDAPLFDVVVLDFMWVHLEPENNVFDWKKMDAIIDYWTKRGKQYSMRICMAHYTPLYKETKEFWWETCEPPAWLFDELGCGYQGATIKGRTMRKSRTLRRPNYYDPIFIEQHQEFLDALA